MTGTNAQSIAAAERYFAELRQARASGAATGERSLYGPLERLLNAAGAALKPRVVCIGELADHGAGHPDFGFFAAAQLRRGRPREAQAPERGVVEVKPPENDAWITADSAQVSRYRDRYRLVLVTNMRDFVLVGAGPDGRPAKLETLRLAASAADFARRLEKPRAFARETGAALGEYLARTLSHRAAVAEPKDLARLLASYARDGLARVESAEDAPALDAVREALEEALGARFEGATGARFFRSTLVQTLFYGVFSAWVLWARQTPPPTGAFDWRTAVWHLRAPVLAALFQQLSEPSKLRRLGLVEVMDWTAAALDRVDRAAFFARFSEGEAVPYFYEPFLEAFDPALRKQLGVWYTPSEVVRYMVARVDRALKDDLGIAEGLAAENVYVLDPCCGTGAYLAEVLRRIAANLKERNLGALAGARVKAAALTRVFGFEIMPAPFVVAHLQVGLALRALDAPLAENRDERAQIILTNALTGWDPEEDKSPLPFPELEEERGRAERVKLDAPILVILGNPPYNGFAGMAVGEESALADAYRAAKRVRKPEGQGLNDLYVRFFRMAERRIVEKTGCGVVCFISNYSWLDGLSFTGMRERYLEAFDAIRIDCLNGDKYKTGKVSPDGSPDPSVFSTESDPVGIQVGTAIATLVRKTGHAPVETVGFRHLWGERKRAALLETAEAEPCALYDDIGPPPLLGLPFAPAAASDGWADWPSLPELFPASFSGVKTGRDAFLVDIDLDRLKTRIGDYFDPALSHDEIARRYPAAMKTTTQFDARAARDELLARGGPVDDGFVRYAYRPFDTRWLYWDPGAKLLDGKRAGYKPHVAAGNKWVSFNKKPQKGAAEPRACVTGHIGCHDLIGNATCFFPAWLVDNEAGKDRRANLTVSAQTYLKRLGSGVEDLFHHVLATLHDPAYREANAGALGLEWPRIPLPGWPGGDSDGAAAALADSAARGRELARLLDPGAPVPGVTQGALRPELAAIAVPAAIDGGNMTGDDFAAAAGWGHLGAAGAVMPGQGRAVERPRAPAERAAAPALGATTFDIYINDRAFWRNVPAAVWRYKLGGYQVLKKWLSYREQAVLGRSLGLHEVQRFSEIARRVAAVLTAAAKSG